MNLKDTLVVVAALLGFAFGILIVEVSVRLNDIRLDPDVWRCAEYQRDSTECVVYQRVRDKHE